MTEKDVAYIVLLIVVAITAYYIGGAVAQAKLWKENNKIKDE